MQRADFLLLLLPGTAETNEFINAEQRSAGEDQLQRRLGVSRFVLFREPEIFLLAYRECDLNRVWGWKPWLRRSTPG